MQTSNFEKLNSNDPRIWDLTIFDGLSNIFLQKFNKVPLVGCSYCAKKTCFIISESSQLRMCFRKVILLCARFHLIGTAPVSKYKNVFVVLPCAFNRAFNNVWSTDYKFAIFTSVTPCHASLLCRIPFMSIICTLTIPH